MSPSGSAARSESWKISRPICKLRRDFSHWNTTGSLSYVTGAHSLKLGGSYMVGYRREQPFVNESISYTFAGTVPETVTLYAYPLDYELNLRIASLYASDQWTINNLTLNLGLRFDQLNGHSPAATSGAGRWVPERTFAEVKNTPDWTDVHPRLGFAYNLFGGNQTVIKANLGHHIG